MDESQYEQLQRPLDVFRAKTKRLRIHPLELTVLSIVCTHLVFLPWAIGGMRPWGQFISLALAIIGFVFALIPRNYTEEHTGAQTFRLIMWPKLIRFPIFWLGLLLLGLVVVQATNPAWTYETDGKGWWMQAIPHNESLPPGVQVPFAQWGPWRMLVIYSSVWLTLCSLWIGLTRRRSVQLFFLVMAANGLLLALLGAAQRLVPNGKMFWVWRPIVGEFFSSFVYKNHAGSYLDLGIFVSCGMAAWYYLRGLRRLEKSNPSGVFAFVATVTAVAVLISYARGATLVMLVYLIVCVGTFVIHQLVLPSENRKPIVAIAMVLIFGYFLKSGLDALHSHIAWDRLAEGVTEKDASLEYRRIATRASLEMLGDHWATGTGAGSFKFLFPTYQQRYPDIFAVDGRRMFWEHAHNDIVETPIELGLAGTLLILGAIGYFAVSLIRSFFWENPLSAAVVLGLLLLVGYAWWDFPFQNPAILMTWWVLLCAVTMWTAFEELNVKG